MPPAEDQQKTNRPAEGQRPTTNKKDRPMTTFDRPSAAAELRGRAFGVTILAFFSIAWTGWGLTGHVPGAVLIAVMALAAIASVGLATVAWRLTRWPDPNPDTDHQHAAPARRNVNRPFGIIVGIEWTGVFAASAVLGATGHPVLVPAVICLGVGLHFLPLARLFHVTAYNVTAGALCLIAVATFVLTPVTSTPALWTLLPGVGAAVVLYATCVMLVRQSRRITHRTGAPRGRKIRTIQAHSYPATPDPSATP
jgi:hypothetical protein